MAQFAAQHPINPPPPSPRRSRNLSLAPEEEEQRQEEINSRVSRPEVAQTQEHPFSTAILAEALPAGVKVSNLSEYDGTGDPQEHLDKFYAKIDWENEPLRDYMERFVETVHEVPHVNHELLASIIQQNLLPGRFKESIAGKPPSTMENLLMRSQKYIWIEESNASDPSLGVKRKGREEEKKPKKERRT
ncbi:UNVERIFIED_CONTAM: hypothetical protein Sangu_3033200 [Sesamum angustifolium]|uniref:Uncharacterized protein n=1 Tax=Sesamum angustifolium TaxID=2727405 RepID=A0AAW2KN68_9LAMI